MEAKATSLDDVLQKFGMVDRYHLKLMILFGIVYVTNSMYASNFVFAAEEVGYRCKDETFGENACVANDSRVCTEWIYDNPHSFVAELACEEWKRILVGSVHSFGYMAGLLIIGPLSDKIGRKITVVLSGVAGGILGVARTYSRNYWLYICLAFLESAIGDSWSPAFVLNLEIVATKKRVVYYGLCSIGFTLGGILLPLAAWSVPYWRNYLRVIYTPALLFFFYIFLIDESPRWLLIKGRKTKAVSILENAANFNNIQLDKDALDKLVSEEDSKGVAFTHLLKMTFTSRALFKRFLICVVWWSTSTFVSYGMTINSVFLQGNRYLNFGLVSAIDLPVTFITTYLLLRFKKKNPLVVSFLVGAVLCFVQPFLPSSLPWLSVTAYILGKGMSSMYFIITYMYTLELFPTYTRNSMHALCSSLGRIGSIGAPQTPLLMTYWPGLPSMIFGAASLIAGLLTFLAPESDDSSLPDTVKQAEAVGTKAKHGIDNLAMSRGSINKDESYKAI